MEHHAASFRRAARDDALADAVHADATTAPLSATDRALVHFAVELTVNPRGPDLNTRERLRELGVADAGILAATEVVCYFNFVNRLATGLDVELESST